MKTPIGLWHDINHIRVIKNVFDKDETRKYIIQEAKRDTNNDVDIAVINEATGKTSIVELNDNYNDFVTIQNKRLSRKLDRMWNKYLISKVKVQKSNLNAKDKSKFVDLARTKYLKQTKLSDKNNTDLENKLKKL
tara:strand:- start:334 stop:738 length:405 start_codon:yes stop_codon:yes gene_type:complete